MQVNRSRQDFDERHASVQTAPALSGGWWQWAVVGGGAIALGFGLVEVFSVLTHPIAVVLAAVVLASGAATPVNWLVRWLPRSLAAVVVVYLLALLVLIGVGWVVVPRLVGQAQDLL